MQERHSIVKDIALGLGVAVVVSGAILAAQQVSTGPTKGARQPDRLDPCCAITAINIKTGTITAKVTKTGQVFTLAEIPAATLAKFTVGGSLEVSCGVPPSGGTTGVTGNAASGTTNCGSNTPRNADTRPKDCVATSSTGVQTPIACPQGVPIKTAK